MKPTTPSPDRPWVLVQAHATGSVVRWYATRGEARKSAGYAGGRIRFSPILAARLHATEHGDIARKVDGRTGKPLGQVVEG
jgi:hypothetical protein